MKTPNTHNPTRQEPDVFIRNDDDYKNSKRHFTPEGYKNIHRLMDRIAEGDLFAPDPFLKAIQPFVDRSATHIAGKVYGDQVDEERVKELVQDMLMELMQKPEIFKTSARSWSDFSHRIKVDLHYKFSADKVKLEQEQNTKVILSADGAVASDEGDPQKALSAEQLEATSKQIIDDLPNKRASQVLKLRLGIGTGEELDLKSIAGKYGVSCERIRQMEIGAYRRLRQSDAAEQLKPHLDYDPHLFKTSSQERTLKQNYWQSQAGSEQNLFRANIRSLFKQPAGTEYSDNILRSAFKLDDAQWNALMKADLARDPKSCEILRKQGSIIFVALSEALSKEHQMPEQEAQEAHNTLLHSIVGIMRIAQEGRNITR